MNETAQQHLDRSLRELAPHIEEAVREHGFAPPFRWHMIAVPREAEERATGAHAHRALFDSAFNEARKEIGADFAALIVHHDDDARLTWVAAVEGVIA